MEHLVCTGKHRQMVGVVEENTDREDAARVERRGYTKSRAEKNQAGGAELERSVICLFTLRSWINMETSISLDSEVLPNY